MTFKKTGLALAAVLMMGGVASAENPNFGYNPYQNANAEQSTNLDRTPTGSIGFTSSAPVQTARNGNQDCLGVSPREAARAGCR